MAAIGSPLVLTGDLLMVFDASTMAAIKLTTNYATTNFKYVICIDSSTCIAADDSTSVFSYYSMTSADFLGATDSVN